MKTKKNGIKGINKLASYLLIGAMGLHSVMALADSTPTPGQTLRGTVKTSRPITGATIRVFDQTGNVLAVQDGATNEDGYFTITVPNANTSGLTVEATNGADFQGTLYGQTDSKNVLGFVYVNPATTLNSLYQQLRPGTSSEQATERTKTFLGLPDIVSIGSGVENPALTLFSANTLEREAQSSGGWDRYTMELALEMTKDSDSTHVFPAQQGILKASPATWLAEKLLAGVASKIGSDLFSGFMAGIGFPGTDTQTLQLLNQVIAKLAEIQAQLHQIEIRIAKGDYNGRAGILVNEYSDYTAILGLMHQTDVIAKANLKPDGSMKDAAIANQVKAAGQEYVTNMKKLGTKFMAHVNAQMMPNVVSMDPLSKVFAEFTYQEAPLITAKYFAQLDEHVAKFQLLQAVTAALVADAQKTDNQVIGQATVQLASEYIGQEKPIYPDFSVFTSKDITALAKGDVYYDRNTNLIWDKHYAHFYTCQELLANQQKGNDVFKSRSYDELVDMVSRANAVNGTSDARYSEVIKALGFSAGDYDGVKMIVHGCTGYGNSTFYNWFGNDQRGPKDQYYNIQGDFNTQKKNKGMGNGFYTMKARPPIQ